MYNTYSVYICVCVCKMVKRNMIINTCSLVRTHVRVTYLMRVTRFPRRASVSSVLIN